MIRRVAILGSGTMGKTLAEFFSQAGLETSLWNRSMCENLSSLSSADWVLETITEDLAAKQALFTAISPHLSENTILTSNTSGIPISKLALGLPETQRRQFFGTHFFQPPEKLKCVELISTANTDSTVFTSFRTFLEKHLNRYAIQSKDQPAFLSTRLGAFARASAIYLGEKYDLSFESVDLLTGPAMGRPKSATFGTLDWVGLDLAAHTFQMIFDAFPNSPFRERFQAPDWMQNLIQRKHLGRKTGGLGCYRRIAGEPLQVYRPKLRRYESLQVHENQRQQDQKFVQDFFKDLAVYIEHLITSEKIADRHAVKTALTHGHGWNLNENSSRLFL